MYKYNQHNGRSGSWCRWSGTEISKPYDGKCPFGCPNSAVLEVKQHWHVNHNMPGYLPESDGVTTAEWSEALDAFREEISRHQEVWSEYCVDQHETDAQLDDCMNGGAERCDWYELVSEAEADRQAEHLEDSEVTWIYNTPEGADVVIFMASCKETDCVMSEDEN